MVSRTLFILQILKNTNHSLLTQYLQVGKLKDMEKIKAWADDIILHFWHCASSCKHTVTTSDDEAVEIMKVVILLQPTQCEFLVGGRYSTGSGKTANCRLIFTRLKQSFVFLVFQNKWIGLLHHVCDEHDWVGGSCEHNELQEHSLPWFDHMQKDFEALQKIILEPQLLASFKSYVRFR